MMYSIGKIVDTHGIKGEVKILSHSDFDRIKVGVTLYIGELPLKVRSVRRQNEYYLVGFEGYLTLTSVEPLRKKEVFTTEEPTLGEDEYHLPKLVGLDVFSMNHLHLGKVDSLVEVPQGYLLRIETNDKRMVYVPFVNAFVKSVSDEGILIETIEGLI
ncbi:16S rRNA processing protein RimM [Acholeplasma equirhinis]|uniref:ribosome maturation factor RimM n=1 Tax=Acholeplasma equirhinis TaxID=555393 RepID=UPI00197AE368|nr:ribosome maturation factor RimM [Acholeplasma equirhinis]MBN3491173.1 16S rRNA processing protein RimM [Acholeplasma equirhinis]